MAVITTSKIEISDFSFFYGTKRVIHNLNLRIEANEILSIIGPSNSGITTLLRALNRLSDLNYDAHSEGEILLEGKNIHDPGYNVTELRRRVGMVFDVPTPLYMSIFDNVAYGAQIEGSKSRSAIADLVEESLRKAVLWDEVKDRLSTPGNALSGGQQQRLCIARVLALSPEVILLDRPCSGLDPISTAKIEESLEALKEQITIVLAPHNVQQASRISDRVAFLLMGDLIEVNTNHELFGNPKDPRTSDYVTGRFG